MNLEKILKGIALTGLAAAGLYFSSCQKKNSDGVLSFYSADETQQSASASNFRANYTPFDMKVTKSFITANKIEVTKDGQTWETIVNEPKDIRINRNNRVKMNASAILPEGQYHGIRITLEPKIVVNEFFNEVITSPTYQVIEGTVNAKPLNTIYSNGDNVSDSNVVTLKSSNETLIPFDIEAGAETYLIFNLNNRCQFDLDDNCKPVSWYRFTVGAYATRFIE